MADHYRDENEGGGGFMMGLLTGTVLGAGLGMLLAPKSGSELRNQLSEGATSLGRRAGGAVSEMTDRARETAHRVGERTRGRAADANSGRVSETGFGSGLGLGSTDTTSPGPGGSMTPGYSGDAGGSTPSSRGSTYTGTTGGFDPDRP
jgi:gas vesicle protein